MSMTLPNDLTNYRLTVPDQDHPDMRATSTVAMIVGPGMTAAAIARMVRLLTETPVPIREPIEVTEAQYQALMELPIAETPQELAELACTFGTAVMVVKPEPAPLEGEILPPEGKTATDFSHTTDDAADAMAYMMKARQKLRRIEEEMMMTAIWGGKLT